MRNIKNTMKQNKQPHDPDEILAVVDDNDNTISKATRREIHQNGLSHREVIVFIVNRSMESNKVLLQQRADNNKWSVSCSGHFSFDETYLQGAIRELKEELGIIVKPKELQEIGNEKFSTKKKSKINNRFLKIYLLDKNISKFDIDKTEVAEVRYFNKKEIQKFRESDEIGKTTKMLVKKYIMPYL